MNHPDELSKSCWVFSFYGNYEIGFEVIHLCFKNSSRYSVVALL